MENRLLIEMDRIKSIMSINENTELLNEGVIDSILSRLITKSVATAEEKLILKFFEKDFSKQITTQADKVAFSKFIKSAEGQTFIKEVEAEIGKLTNPNAQRYAQRSLDRMETAATSWESLGVGSRTAPAGKTSRTAPAGKTSRTAPAGKSSTTAPIGNNVAKVDIKTINKALDNFETTFPNLFQKKWYGSFINQARIDGIRDVMIRDFAGKDAKGIEEIIERKLDDAEKALIKKNSNIPPETKSLLGQQISNLRSWFKKTPIKDTLKVLGLVTIGGTLAYLTYSYIMEWVETGSPITAAMALPFRVFGDAKSGVNRNKPHDNTPEGFLKYVKGKYGDNDYTNPNKFKLTPPNADGIIKLTSKDGKTKSFKHNGNTFIEQN
jgi:hypothetical protein